MRFEVVFKDGKRTVTPQPVFGAASRARSREPAAHHAPGVRVARRRALTVAQVGPAELVVQTVVQKKALVGGGRA